MFRLLFLLPLAAALGGCMTVLSARQGDDLPQEKLRDDSKSIVLLHTSLHESYCLNISLTLAQQNAAGEWVKADTLNIKGQLDLAKLPSQFVLPAGEYGIVNVACLSPRISRRAFIAKQLTRGSVWDGSRATFEKPFATFKVLPGEVVDIGSLRMPSTPQQYRVPGKFIAVVTAIPDDYLGNLAAKNPDLYQRRVTRPMQAAIRI